jgi:hypothetical protein
MTITKKHLKELADIVYDAQQKAETCTDLATKILRQSQAKLKVLLSDTHQTSMNPGGTITCTRRGRQMNHRLTTTGQEIARLRKKMLRSDSAAEQAAIWEVIKYYQELESQGKYYLPKF